MLEYLSILFSAPILWIMKVQNNLGSRISVVETKQTTYEKKIDKMCSSTDDLTKEVHTMIGRLDEHLRK